MESGENLWYETEFRIPQRTGNFDDRKHCG